MIALGRSLSALALIAVVGACATDGLTAPAAAPLATPESRLAAALQGRVSGVQAVATGSVRLGCRLGDGQATGEALFVIDGLAHTAAEWKSLELDPTHIADVEILKGPDAVPTYGERASHGAVVITTRRL